MQKSQRDKMLCVLIAAQSGADLEVRMREERLLDESANLGLNIIGLLTDADDETMIAWRRADRRALSGRLIDQQVIERVKL